MGYKYVALIINSLPYGLSEYATAFITNKVTFCYSSFPGPRKGYNYGGTHLINAAAFAPAIGTASSAIIFLSLGSVMKLGFIADPRNIDNP